MADLSVETTLPISLAVGPLRLKHSPFRAEEQKLTYVENFSMTVPLYDSGTI